MWVAQILHETLFEVLIQSGSNRGNLLGLFTPRIQALTEDFQVLKPAQAEKVLLIHGIGPKVVQNCLLLRGLVES